MGKLFFGGVLVFAMMAGCHGTSRPNQADVYSAEAHYAMGQHDESNGSIRDAISEYRMGLKANPAHAPSVNRLAVLYGQQKDYSRAIEQWKRYIELAGPTVESYNSLAQCQELEGKYDDAEASYKRGLVSDPTAESCRINYGLMLARRGRPEEALEQLQMAFSPAEAHLNLGAVYEQEGERAKARVEYEKALELNPGLVEAKAKLAGMK